MTDVLDQLRDATQGQTDPASADDVVDEMPARWVARPGSTEETAAVLRICAEQDQVVVPRGRATKLGWGLPPSRLDVLLDLTRLDQLVDHAAGDHVAVVGAGRRLSELQSDIAGADQLLAVDPAQDGTVGGTIATGATGPLRLAHGAVRDLLLGVTMVRADGVVAHSGGRVVKNVAGYDVAKLLAGSLGTLAIITQAAFRLHPKSPARSWITVPVTTAERAQQVVQSVIHSPTFPAAVELDRSSSSMLSVAVLLEGTGPGVDQRSTTLRELLGAEAASTPDAPDWWGQEPGATGDTELKVTHEIGALQRMLAAVTAAEDASGLAVRLRGSVAIGSVLAVVPGSADPVDIGRFVAALRQLAPRFGGTVVVRDGPMPVKQAVDVWGPVRGLELMRAVKHRFDPESRLSPGRFVGGI